MRTFRHSQIVIPYGRQLILVVFLFFLTLIIGGRLFYLQILKGSDYELAANRQHKIEQVLLQRRGEIFMHDSTENKIVPIVINKNLTTVYAVPKEITDPYKVAKELANIFEDPEGVCQKFLPADAAESLVNKCKLRKEIEESFYKKVSKHNDPYEPIRDKVDEATVNLIKAKKIKGIYFKDDWVRYYPEKEKVAQVTGFWGYNKNGRVGQYGVEGYYDDELTGEAGKFLGDKDLFGRMITAGETKLIQAQDGDDIVLTLDRIIQDKAYEIIQQAVKDYGAEHGTIIVMNPQNGEIKAMAGYPSYDPNNYNKVDNISVYRNLNISEPYEPGSIFKVITMAIGLDSGVIKPDDEYFDEGFIKLGKYKIRNADNKKYGQVNMTKILEDSINTGAAHIALETGRIIFKRYLNKFGFFNKLSIGLVGVAGSNFKSLNKPSDTSLATASYGQGITVTPLQMITAVSIIANGGHYIEPVIVDRINNKQLDKIIKSHEVISSRTANIVKAMMVSVIKNGHGKKAGVPGYYLGGKTGTAEIAAKGKYSNENNHSFVGFGPLDNTKFVIMVKISKPKWGKYSAVTAAPTFAKMANFLLQYYKIPPDYSEE